MAAYLVNHSIGEYEVELRRVADRAAHGTVLVAAEESADAQAGDRLVGTVTVLLEIGPWSEVAAAGEAEIRMLAVDATARGAGVGTALTRAAMGLASAGGTSRIVLSTQSTAHPAHRIYGRLGFTRRPDLDWSPRPGVDLLGYMIDL